MIAPTMTVGDIGYGEKQTVEVGPYTVHVTTDYDSDSGPPWRENDGHGPVRDGSRGYDGRIDKRPGELVLNSGRNGCNILLYDFAAACKLARKDWGCTTRKAAAEAARKDFEYLRGWCNDDWQYLGVQVRVEWRGEEIGDDSVWGVESEGDHWREVACDLANHIIGEHAIERNHAAQAAIIERRERKYWAARDVPTGEPVHMLLRPRTLEAIKGNDFQTYAEALFPGINDAFAMHQRLVSP